MATVVSQLTRIHDVEGSLSLTSIGGGAGASANTELFIQGAQAVGRKQSNATDHGFYLAVASRDVSSVGVHVGVWLNHIHYAVLTKLALRLGSTTANYHEHVFPLTAYPAKGGWIRTWINVARTPEASGGTFDKANLTQVGILASLPSVGGNAPNLVMDASDYTTAGLLLTGTDGVFADFLAADEANGSNKYGIVTSDSGVVFCLARLTLGSASLLAFNDSNFVIIFPNQTLVASDFMGITVDLQNASTVIDWNSAVVKSAGTTRGDLVVTGTSGDFSVTNSTLSGLRVVSLTAACVIDSCLISGSGQITAAGAMLTKCSVVDSIASSALLWDVASDPNGKLDGTSFTMGTSGHGLELGPDCLNTIGLTNVSFSGYGANDTMDAALYNNSGKTITINRSGGTSPTIRNSAGSDTIINESVSLTISANVSLVGAEVRIYDLDIMPPDYGTELAGVESHTAAEYVYSGASGNVIVVQIMLDGYEEFVVQTTMPSSNGTLPVTLVKERNA